MRIFRAKRTFSTVSTIRDSFVHKHQMFLVNDDTDLPDINMWKKTPVSEYWEDMTHLFDLKKPYDYGED